MVNLLAQLMPPESVNSMNASLYTWLIAAAVLVLQILTMLKGLKRQPSFDVDFAKVIASVKSLDEKVKETTKSLDESEEALADLRDRLTGKLGVMDQVTSDLKEIKARLTHGDEVMSQLREKQSANAAIIVEIKGGVHEQNLRLEGMQRNILSIQATLPHKKS